MFCDYHHDFLGLEKKLNRVKVTMDKRKVEKQSSSIFVSELSLSDYENYDLFNKVKVFVLLPKRGAFSVQNSTNKIIVQASQLLLLPQGQRFSIKSLCGSALIAAIEHEALQEIHEPKMVASSPLIGQMFDVAHTLNNPLKSTEYRRALVRMIALEIQQLPELTQDNVIVMPSDRRLAYVCNKLVQNPGTRDSMDVWCQKIGMSRRNFTRTFKQETGYTFVKWRRELRMVNALSQLLKGEKVTFAALEAGYENVSAFSAAFHNRFGAPPIHFKQ